MGGDFLLLLLCGLGVLLLIAWGFVVNSLWKWAEARRAKIWRDAWLQANVLPKCIPPVPSHPRSMFPPSSVISLSFMPTRKHP